MRRQNPIATWNKSRDVWETSQPCLLSGRLDVFSEIWPDWGMTRNGAAYALPPLGHRTTGNEFSCSHTGPYLPTPQAVDGQAGATNPDIRRDNWKQVHIVDITAYKMGHRSPTSSPFGIYEKTISRWAKARGIPAPYPTELGPTGSPRATVEFVEWVMGLPPGWISDLNVTRGVALKALGNGVVPQQAQSVLERLLQVEKE